MNVYPVAAESLGERLREDPEIRLPQRPRLPPELIVLPLGRHGLIFEGGKRTQLITGASARTLLPEVLRRLDGTRSCAEIAAELPRATQSDVENIVALLFASGVLEDGDSSFRRVPQVEAYLGRFVDVTRNNRNRAEAMARLHDASVAVAGSTTAAESIVAQLRASGIGKVGLSGRGGASRIDLVVAVATGQNEDLAPLLEQAHTDGIPALHVRIAGTEAQIGPLFVPGQTACYGCMRLLYELPAGDAEPLFRSFWIARAALQAVHILSRVADVRVLNGYDAYEQTADGLLEAHRYIARLPGCRHCGIDAAPVARHSTQMLAWLFHNSVGLPPRSFASRRAHQRHYLAQNLAETRRKSDPFFARSMTALGPASMLETPLPWEGTTRTTRPITVGGLTTILQTAAGYQHSNGKRRRIVPTGGGMGSPGLFVVAQQVEGLTSGIYHYCPERHTLVRLSDLSSERLHTAGLGELGASCLLVGAAALQKLRFKYYNFAYRIAYLDAGFALGCVLDVASALGYGAWAHFGYRDETVAELVRLPRKDNQNVVSFLVGLGVERPGEQPGGPGAERPVLPIADSGDFALRGPRIFESLVAAAAVPEGAGVKAITPAPETGVVRTGVRMGRLLRARRSRRSFAETAPEQRAVSYVMQVSATHLRRLWIARVGSPELDVGIYESPPAGDADFRRVRALAPEDMRECLNQEALARAPALLIFESDLGQALTEYGARGYREELLEAGRAAWRATMAAQAMGLGTCPTAGLIDAGVRQVLGGDGYHRCPLLALAIGYPES